MRGFFIRFIRAAFVLLAAVGAAAQGGAPPAAYMSAADIAAGLAKTGAASSSDLRN